MAKVALLTVHGMGNTERSYADGLRQRLSSRLGAKFHDVAFCPIYYQDLLQANENEVWRRTDQGSKLHYDDLRKFLLFGFGDAAGLENGKELADSTYERAQVRIARAMLDARRQLGGNGPVVLISHSLGCQVLSSYVYDAQKSITPAKTKVGIWSDIDGLAPKITDGPPLSDDEKTFLRGNTLMRWLSTGCNIPIFVAAHKTMDIKPIKPVALPDFKWLNVFDPDDVLGWPLRPLSTEYAALVEDRSINAGQGVVNWILKSWNPLSHMAYWDDDDAIDPLVAMLREYV